MGGTVNSAKKDYLKDFVDLDSLMDEISVSDRQLELAAGDGSLANAMSGSSNPGVNCTGGCN
jgi:hypothetical protein